MSADAPDYVTIKADELRMLRVANEQLQFLVILLLREAGRKRFPRGELQAVRSSRWMIDVREDAESGALVVGVAADTSKPNEPKPPGVMVPAVRG
jgi:hypothetical protein